MPVHLQETYQDLGSASVFNYPDYENMVILLNNYTKGLQIDSSCRADSQVVQHVIKLIHFFTNIDTTPIKDRICEVFYRDGQTILLLNMKQENYDNFLSAVNSFRIIDQGEWIIDEKQIHRNKLSKETK